MSDDEHLYIYVLPSWCLGGTICNFSSMSVSCNSELILRVFTSPASQATLIVTDTASHPVQVAEDTTPPAPMLPESINCFYSVFMTFM